MGFVTGNFGSHEKEAAAVPAPQPPPPPPPPPAQPASSLPNWMPVPAENGEQATPVGARVTRSAATVAARATNGSGPKKRGRPRKYPLPS